MTTYATQGWDIVGAITQKALNAGLGALYDRGTLPKHIETEIPLGIFRVSASFEVDRPIVNLAGMAQGIAKITFNITSGVFKVQGDPNDYSLVGSSFTVSTAIDKVSLTNPSGDQRIVKIFFNFKSDQAVFTAQITNLPRQGWRMFHQPCGAPVLARRTRAPSHRQRRWPVSGYFGASSGADASPARAPGEISPR